MMPSRHGSPPEVAPDHLVVAAPSLARGIDWVADKLGARPAAGGKHVAMGTHNALLRLGPKLYLEVIAIDPEGTPPSRPRWFDLDEPRMRARLAEEPALIHWVARTRDIERDATCSREDLGALETLQRGDFRWRMTIPADGHLPARGLVPTLIEWSGTRHPCDTLPAAGVELVALAAEHPDPAPVRAALAALGLSETLKVTYGRTPRLAAMVRTPRGVVTL
jgi:glyoxalase-like protein